MTEPDPSTPYTQDGSEIIASSTACQIDIVRPIDACAAGEGSLARPAPQGDADEPLSAMTIRRRRLLFRSTHRGTFENDLMIGGFVQTHLAALTESDLDALELVMELPDTDLADWLSGRLPIPPGEETPMLRRMRDFLIR